MTSNIKIQPWILLSLFTLSNITETSYTASLPIISHYFQVKGGIAQLSSSVYFFGFATGILFLGRVSDIFGRRPVIIGGISLYIICTIILIFSTTIKEIILLRFIQAFGASVGSVVAQAMARDSYKGEELSYVYASLAIGIALAPSVGSAIGGYIVEYLGWHYIFVFLSIISSLMLLSYIIYLPETNRYIGKSKNRYFTVLRVVVKDKVILFYAIIIGSLNGTMFGFFIEAPFIFSAKANMLPSTYGKLVFLLCIAGITGSFINRKLIKKQVNSFKIMNSGLLLSLTGTMLLLISSLILEHVNNKYIIIIAVIFPMMLHMIGQSMIIPIALRYSLEDYAKVTGSAGSIFGAMYYLIIALINFIISKVHDVNIIKFSILLFILSLICYICSHLIQKFHPIRKIYEFN